MRVTHLSASGELGGAERVLLECIAALPGVKASVVSLGPGGLIDAANRMGAETRVVVPPPELAGAGDAFGAGSVWKNAVPILRDFPAFFGDFSRAVLELAPDVVHSHGIKTHVLGALLPRGVPLVWHLHDYVGSRAVSWRLLRLLANRVSVAIAVSESVADDARSVLPEPLPIHVVHNAVDVDRFVPVGPVLDLDALAALPAASPGTVRIGMPATFAKWKGHEVFIEALARLGRPDARAYIVGAPLYETRNSQWSRAALEALVRVRSLEGRVGFTGYVSDTPAAYRALDIVVHASTRPEPFGLVIAEAMACGRAVIASPVGGAGELFVDGVEGVAVSGGDAELLASALRRLVEDPRRRQALGAAARTHAVAAFARPRFAADLSAALSRAGSAAAALEPA